MLRNISGLAKRLLIAVVLSAGMFTAAALQRTSANAPAPGSGGSDFTCTNINVDGRFTGNIFCTSSTSSAGFYYYYYNVYTGVYTIGP